MTPNMPGIKTPDTWRSRLKKLFIIVPPILFILYVGHSLMTIRDLLSESSTFHLAYANDTIQDYFELSLDLETQSQRACLLANGRPCEEAIWLDSEPHGPIIASLPDANGTMTDLYLRDDEALGRAVKSFIDEHNGLNAIFEKRGHDPVYWFRILSAESKLIYQSGDEPTEAKARGSFSMDRSLQGYHLDIIYNSFGAKKLFSVAQNRINFGVIFLLFIFFVFSLGLIMHSIRNKLFLARQKTFFVTTVSHEFKTPLAIMRLAVETIQAKRFRGPDDENRFVNMLVNEINRLDQLVHKVLSFNKIDMGQVRFNKTEADLKTALSPSIDAFQVRAEAGGYTFKLDLDPQPCAVIIDSGLFRQAVDNILDNAFKYGGETKYVALGWRRKKDRVRLWISDRGVGMPKDELRHILRSFYRIDEPGTRGIRGSGLGLSVAHHLLEGMGVELEIESVHGEGSTFTLIIPTPDGD